MKNKDMRGENRPFLRIKPKRKGLVKLTALIALALSSQLAIAVPPAESEFVQIRARKYDVSVVRSSRSKNIYLFNDTPNAKPKVGKVLLLKRDGNPVMAFRVLKQYEGRGQFAAKKLREYGVSELGAGESFTAFEKLGDLPAPAPPSAEDLNELKELENQEASSTDQQPSEPAPSPSPSSSPSVDEAIPPPTSEGTPPAQQPDTPAAAQDPAPQQEADPAPAPATEEEKTENAAAASEAQAPPASEGEVYDSIETDFPSDIIDERNLIGEELNPIDSDKNWLSLNFGLLRNYNTTVDQTTGEASRADAINLAALGIRYARTVSMMPFLRKPNIQDSFAIEGGLYYYKIVGYESESDTYSVMPIVVTGRYNVLFGESYGAFLYAGVMKNFVLNSQQSSEEGISTLGGIIPAVGGGLLFKVGPSWLLRADLGFDVVGVGLVLRF